MTETKITEALGDMLADSYTLYLKTHNYHWNVTGPMFTTLHTLFETQYNDLALAVDEIAERIRALGEFSPGSYTAFQKRAKVKEASETVPSAQEMIEDLAADQEKVVEAAKRVHAAAEAGNDQASGDLAVRRMEVHQKAAWMLRSHLEA